MSQKQKQKQQVLLEAHFVSHLQLQNFIEEFRKDVETNKTFNIIEEQFIKKYRHKNSLSNQNKSENFKEFITAFKDTAKYYDAYHQQVQNSLEKFEFCKDLKKFFRDLYRSQQKISHFFLNQIEFHQTFVEENQEKFRKKVQNFKEVCSKCKQNTLLKSFQSLKQNISYQFTDPFELYQKQRIQTINSENDSRNVENIFQSYKTNQVSNLGLQGQTEFQLAQLKLKQILNKCKKSKDNALQQIFDMFQHKQQAEMNSINHVKINEMFYDLQNELDSRSHQIQDYLEELMSFNDRLINYNPKLINKYEPYQQTQPQSVDKQLKFNFGKIVKKIYKKVNELIKKRKEESISVETQVNFLQDNVIKDLEKQKKKLAMELKQSQQDKLYVTNNLKEQNERIKNELKKITQQRVKFQIEKDQALAERNSLQKQLQRLVKVVDQMKKQIERLTHLLEREKRNLVTLKKQNKNGPKKSGFMNANLKDQVSDDLRLKQQEKWTEQRYSKGKNLEQQFLEQFERNQLQLFKILAKKRARSKKKFLAPKRSKLMQTIQFQQSVLTQAMSRFSKNMNPAQIFEDTDNNNRTESPSKKSETSQQNQSQDEDKQNNKYAEPTIQQNIDQNLEQIDEAKQGSLKNHKSKTFTKLNNNKINDKQWLHGQSSRQICETQQDIQKRLEQLQQIKKMKQLQSKLAAINKKNTESLKKNTQKSTIRFHIQKQIQESVSLSKNRFKSKISSTSRHQKGPQVPSKLSKEQLSKKFLKNSETKNIFSLKNVQQVKQRKSSASISITSKNQLNLYQQICDEIQQNRNHVGTQTLQKEDWLLKMVFQEQIANRKWNQLILTFDAFKFGYEQFVTQLSYLIDKEEKNPIRKLNGFKGSSSVLNKSHNYRFNKQNLFRSTWKQSNDNETSTDFISPYKANIEKQYFVPKPSVQRSLNKNLKRTFGTFNEFTKDQSLEVLNAKTLNCMTISDFKNIPNRLKKSQGPQMDGQLVKHFKKKGFYTLHNVNTSEGFTEQQQKQDQQEEFLKQKLPVISENQKIIKLRYPSFQRQDAENLFFSIQSAKAFENKVRNAKTNSSFLGLEQNEIHFSTEFLAILAHIHLIQNSSYEQIKKVLTYPVKIMNNLNENANIEDKVSIQESAELSLKKGLGYIIQLHRNCRCEIGQKVKKIKSIQQKSSKIQILRRRPICEHLLNFKRKVAQVIKTHQSLKKQPQFP